MPELWKGTLLTSYDLGICHSGGGALLKHKMDMALAMDLGIDSVYYQYTSVSSLARL